MNNKVSQLMIAAVLVTAILYGCETSERNAPAEHRSMPVSPSDMKIAGETPDSETPEAASAEELREFRTRAELMIQSSERQLSELKVKMKQSGKELEAVYARSIDSLEQRIDRMKSRLDSFNQEKDDWASFKRTFNEDLQDLGDAVKSIKIK